MAARTQKTSEDKRREILAAAEKELETSSTLNGTTTDVRFHWREGKKAGIPATDYPKVSDYCTKLEEKRQQSAEPAASTADPEGFDAWDIDTELAEQHLAAVGIGPNDPVILCAYGKSNRYVPDRFDFYPPEVGQQFKKLQQGRTRATKEGTPEEQAKATAALAAFDEKQYRYDWDKVRKAHEERMAKGLGRDWDAVRKHLQSPGTPNLGYIGCPGGTATKKREEIFCMPALAQEIDQFIKRDNKGNTVKVPPEEQMEAPIRAGLPIPTVRMDTGGKSIHQYWVLTEPCGVEEGQTARKRLFAAINKACPELTCDGALHSAHQPLRLAGGIHPKTRKRSQLIQGSGEIFRLEDLMALCPATTDTNGNGSGPGTPNDQYEDEPHPGETFPDLPVSEIVSFPLARALSKKTQRLIIHGQKEGVGEGRFKRAHSLSRSLQAATQQLDRLGQPFAGCPEQLFNMFVIASKMFEGEGTTEQRCRTAQEKHWEKDADAVGEPELSDLALRRVIRRWAEEEGLWHPDREGLLARTLFAKSRNQTWEEVAVWRVNALMTAERVVEEALKVKAMMEGAPLTCHQDRFLRYDPEAGYYVHLSSKKLKREIAKVLPEVHIVRQRPKNVAIEEQSHKAATEAKATACVKWLNTVLHEEHMDILPAVAFSNGTYLLDQKTLVEHSQDYRLTWAIQGEYVKDAKCPEEFRRFVASSFGEEWLDVIRMTLRYLIDPTFKPQKIVTILGQSGSGKGTLERLIEKLFPRSCISVITSGFGDINHPDKIRQFVRGKRLVAFPDLQGRQMGVGTLYSMTDGGLLTSRQLHESDADEGEAFKGRVVICSTQPPIMEDAGNGMTRRMLVLKTLNPEAGRVADADLDEKLEAELGDIVSWTLQVDASAVKNMLNVGDDKGLLASAVTNAEVAMDSIRGFIDCCLSPAPEREKALTDTEDLFQAFELYRTDRNHRAMNRNTFVSRISQALPHLKLERKTVPGTNSRDKTKPCFYGLQLNPGLVIAKYSMGADEKNRVTAKDRGIELDRRKYSEGGLEELRCIEGLVTPDAATIFESQKSRK